MPRVLVGGIAHELHSFVPGSTDMGRFERGLVTEGDAALEDTAGTSLDGALEVASARGLDVLPTLLAYAGGGPPVDESTFEVLSSRLLDRVRAAAGTFDAVYLPLHGAMGTTERDDPEGDLIEAVRAIAGPEIPIVVSLDLHAHLTQRMVSGADAIIGYRTCPHTDIRETGARAMQIVGDTLAGDVRPTTAHRKIRLLTSSEAHDTAGGPLTAFQAHARELEEQTGTIAVSIFATQPWMDVPDVGWSVAVTTDGDPDLAQRQADGLARELWDARDRYHVVKTPIADALDLAGALRGRPGPVVVSDGADSPSAGALGDGTALLSEIISRAVDLETLLLVTDPAAVRAAARIGAGGTFDSTLGGRCTPEFFTPLRVRAEVVRITEGRYRSAYPPAPVDAGLTAILRLRRTTVVVTEHPVPQLDLEPYRRLGLDPTAGDLVQAKSAGGFRAYYEPIAAAVVDLDTRGPCDSDLPRLPYRRITRPLWPFDADLEDPW